MEDWLSNKTKHPFRSYPYAYEWWGERKFGPDLKIRTKIWYLRHNVAKMKSYYFQAKTQSIKKKIKPTATHLWMAQKSNKFKHITWCSCPTNNPQEEIARRKKNIWGWSWIRNRQQLYLSKSSRLKLTPLPSFFLFPNKIARSTSHFSGFLPSFLPSTSFTQLTYGFHLSSLYAPAIS